MIWLDGITDSTDMNVSKLWETVKDRQPGMLQSMGLPRVRHNLATEQQQRGPSRETVPVSDENLSF